VTKQADHRVISPGPPLPDDYAAHGERGRAFLEASDWDQAIAHYDLALVANPRLFDGYVNRGLAWRAKGRPDHAIDDFGEAIRLQPDVASAWYNRALAFQDQGAPARAIADLSEAIRRNPLYAQAFYHRAIGHARGGDAVQAQADFAQAARLDPALLERAEFVQAFNVALARRTSHPFLKACACALIGAALGVLAAGRLSAEASAEIAASALFPTLITGWLAWRSAKAWPFWRIAATFVVIWIVVTALAALAGRWR